MTPPSFECVANVSEGRREPVIEALADAVRGIDGVTLRDRSFDPSHNRSVFTMTGEAAPLHRAVVALYGVAVDRIDLRRHTGVHPRIGAVDVVPFVPLSRVTMDDAVRLAGDVARDVAGRFSIPVFLYGDAARRPERRALERVRQGGFEGLRARLRTPDGRPDVGPAEPHPTAGASAIGARPILIAFNVNLTGEDPAPARQIASAIRERDGGLPGVKALGLPLAHRRLVQVSINLVDYRRTALRVVFERVQHEAERRGLEVVDSEIVGLVPRDALADAGPDRLRLTRFSESQILETDPLRPSPAGSPRSAAT